MIASLVKTLALIMINFGLVNPPAFANSLGAHKPLGTSVGNFATNPEFDYQMGYPRGWSHSEYTNTSGSTEWLFINDLAPDVARRSKVSVEFLKNHPANSKASLRAEIEKQHPGLTWTEVSNFDFVGFSSGDKAIGTKRSEELQYFLIQSNKVVKVVVVKDAYENGAAEAQLISQTISKSSRPPRVISIESSKLALQVGELFCYFVRMDDLRDSFNKITSKAFQFTKIPALADSKTLEWNPTLFRFEICKKVTKALTSENFEIQSFSFYNDRHQAAECYFESAGKLSCSSGQILTYTSPKVNNPSPDTSGPIIESMIARGEKVLIEVREDSKLLSLEIELSSKKSIVLLPDQLNGNKIEIDLSKILTSGFNLITRVIVADELKNTYRLSVDPNTSGKYQAENNFKTSETKLPVVSIWRQK